MSQQERDCAFTLVQQLLEKADNVYIHINHGVNDGYRIGSTRREIERNGTCTITICINGGATDNIPTSGMVELAPGKWMQWPEGVSAPIMRRRK